MPDGDEPLAIPLKEHLAALRDADQRFDAERDRRLTEVAVEREKALKIKETADLAALQLARADQTYKDEQANKLREQINSERNIYVTQDQLLAALREMSNAVKPLADFVSKQQGGRDGFTDARLTTGTVLGAVSVLLVLVFGVISVIGR
jgi:hypothetical protein